MSQHTPGPWRASIEGWHGTEDKRIYIYQGYLPEAEIAAVDTKLVSPTQAIADAVLIAVSPDLLQRLRSLTHVAEALHHRQQAGKIILPSMWSKLFREVQKASAVIARTETVTHEEASASAHGR